MRTEMGLVVLGLALAWGLSACATKYGIPDGGPHWKSWDHFQYSNSVWWAGEKEKPPLTKDQYEKAKAEKWWGVPVIYSIDELK
jgi:hypothetical protein